MFIQRVLSPPLSVTVQKWQIRLKRDWIELGQHFSYFLKTKNWIAPPEGCLWLYRYVSSHKHIMKSIFHSRQRSSSRKKRHLSQYRVSTYSNFMSTSISHYKETADISIFHSLPYMAANCPSLFWVFVMSLVPVCPAGPLEKLEHLVQWHARSRELSRTSLLLSLGHLWGICLQPLDKDFLLC